MASFTNTNSQNSRFLFPLNLAQLQTVLFQNMSSNCINMDEFWSPLRTFIIMVWRYLYEQLQQNYNIQNVNDPNVCCEQIRMFIQVISTALFSFLTNGFINNDNRVSLYINNFQVYIRAEAIRINTTNNSNYFVSFYIETEQREVISITPLCIEVARIPTNDGINSMIEHIIMNTEIISQILEWVCNLMLSFDSDVIIIN